MVVLVWGGVVEFGGKGVNDLERYQAVKNVLDITKRAIDAGALNGKGFYNTSASNVADFIEILSERLEKMDTPGDNY